MYCFQILAGKNKHFINQKSTKSEMLIKMLPHIKLREYNDQIYKTIVPHKGL